MKLLINVDELGPRNGITVQVHQTARELAARGHRMDLVYVTPGPLEESYEEFCETLLQVGHYDLYVESPKTLRGILSAMKVTTRVHPDVVYVNRFRPLLWARAVGGIRRAPVVCHLHGIAGAEHLVVNRFVSLGLHRYIAVSSFVRDEFLKLGVREEAIRVVHNGIDAGAYPSGGLEEREASRARLGLPADAYVIGFIGRIEEGKGPDVLARAAALAHANRPDIHLLYVGDLFGKCTLEGLRRDANGVPIHWLPNQVDVVTAYHAADVIVLPSVFPEPFGRVVIEGMATGRPVVGSRIGGIPEILHGSFPDQLFPPGDVEALASVLESLYGWREHSPDLGPRGVDLVQQRFSLKQMVDGVEQVLEEALNS